MPLNKEKNKRNKVRVCSRLRSVCFQERDEYIIALKEENERLLGKMRCIEEPEKDTAEKQ